MSLEQAQKLENHIEFAKRIKNCQIKIDNSGYDRAHERHYQQILFWSPGPYGGFYDTFPPEITWAMDDFLNKNKEAMYNHVVNCLRKKNKSVLEEVKKRFFG